MLNVKSRELWTFI